MLTFLGFSMIVVFMYLIMSKRLSAFSALTVVPVIFALIAGFTDLGPMMMKGLETIAPTAIMIIFAILYFGVLIDTGLFDPLVAKVIKVVGGDPLKIVVGTAVLSLIVALDGDGTITYLIVVTAFLPLYNRLGMNKLILACMPALAMGVMNPNSMGGTCCTSYGGGKSRCNRFTSTTYSFYDCRNAMGFGSFLFSWTP